jgi:hypothetical protein
VGAALLICLVVGSLFIGDYAVFDLERPGAFVENRR